MHLAGAVAFLALAGGAFWLFARNKSDTLKGNPFSASQYQLNVVGMRGNKYVVSGTIVKQLGFRSSDSARLFSMDVKESESDSAEPVPVPVLVSGAFSGINIQVGQKFQMSVLVNKVGTLIAEDIRKS